MSVPARQPLSVQQQAWDMATELADRGQALAAIVSHVVDATSPRVDDEVTRSIPPRGRAFWSSMSKAIAWGAAIDVCLLVLGSTGARPVPGLTFILCLGVLVWAVAFGFVAGNHKVRERRFRAAGSQREVLERVATEGARRVWAAQVPGNWQPFGPPPVARARLDDAVATAWIRRFGAESGEVLGSLVDGTVDGIRRAIRAGRGVPVALFIREPGVFTNDAQSLADACGVALFAIGPAGLHPMSAVASTAMLDYDDFFTSVSPVGLLTIEWAAAADRRKAAL